MAQDAAERGDLVIQWPQQSQPQLQTAPPPAGISPLLTPPTPRPACVSPSASLDAVDSGDAVAQQQRGTARCIVRIQFNVPPGSPGLRWAMAEGGDPADSLHVYTSAGLSTAPCWFPCVDNSSERCTWSLDFTVPEDFVVVAPGKLLRTTQQTSETRTFTYALEVPTLPRHIGFAAGPFEGMVDPNLPHISYFGLPGTLDRIACTTAFLSKALRSYEQTLECPYPYPFYTQVFVEDPHVDVGVFAGLCVVDAGFLHGPENIDEVIPAREQLCVALAKQWFGCYTHFKRCRDMWLFHGLSEYLAACFLSAHLGNNHVRYTQMKKNDDVCSREWRTPLCVGPEDTVYPADVLTPRFATKAYLVTNMLERQAGGQSAWLKLVRSLLRPAAAQAPALVLAPSAVLAASAPATAIPAALATAAPTAAVAGEQATEATAAPAPAQAAAPKLKRALSTRKFLHTLKVTTGKDFKQFSERWLLGRGLPTLTCGFEYNRKRHQTDFAVRLDSGSQSAGGGGGSGGTGPAAEKPSAVSLTVRIHELDGTYDQQLPLESDLNLFELTCHSRARKARRKRVQQAAAAGQDAQQDAAVAAVAASATAGDEEQEAGPTPGVPVIPVLWVQVDPEYECIRKVAFRQSESMWIAQLEMDKDVRAQSEAVRALGTCASVASVNALGNLLNNDQAYWGVRAEAAAAIARTSAQPSAPRDLCYTAFSILSKVFRSKFFDASGTHPSPNDFSDFALYFVKKAIPPAVGAIRGPDERALPEAVDFLLLLLKANDNSRNRYTDPHYVASLLSALGCARPRSARDLRRMVKQARRFLALERVVPSPKGEVAAACLHALCAMTQGVVAVAAGVTAGATADASQLQQLLPDELRLGSTELFWQYATHSKSAVRVAALQCVAKLALRDEFERVLSAVLGDRSVRAQVGMLRWLTSMDRAKYYAAAFCGRTAANAALVHSCWSRLNTVAPGPDCVVRGALLQLYRHIWGVGTPAPVFRADTPALSLTRARRYSRGGFGFGYGALEATTVVPASAAVSDVLEANVAAPTKIIIRQRPSLDDAPM
eukprot:TRINITY_DN3845_c0_g1_i1.p1 TRINITY_DN3845_c0_g1~~TRINITY_DN3845_c0_g1_i1.p1  ORF type:complete len:1204 (-),score=269.23 TRINITY_DN3845_c0_g1_i1:38-3205(-)